MPASVTPSLDSRPIIVAIAGPNGAGKSTFFQAYLRPAGLRFINADDLARELGMGPYESAALADQLRRELIRQRESFIFETVLSDPVGEKVSFLGEAVRSGYAVVLCFIGLDSAETSEQRVAMRVSQGGHDVPTEKLIARFARTLVNLDRAIRELPRVLVYDNSDLRHPFRSVVEFENGNPVRISNPVPEWLKRNPDWPKG